jgi:penicillin G amidase
MKKFFLLLVSFAFLVAGVAAAGLAFLRRFLPQTEGSTRLTGLHGPVEIVRDRWGVPHIYAEDEDDLFFAQGYVHAQDRLWQMELQRRLGSGRLSEILGEPTLEVDRFVRTVGLNRAAEDEVNSLPAETRRALDAYAAGVNSSIRQRRGQWSLEFTLLRCEPQPWRPVDSLYWSKFLTAVLSGNWASETLRARLAVKLGADLAADLEPAYPADNPTVVSGPGLPPGVEPPPNGWRSPAVREALKLVESLLAGDVPRPQPPTPPVRANGSQSGVIRLNPGASNQWVVSGARTATGRPLLANDTHMSVAMPAIWYQVHLEGGRYHVAGVSLPCAPGVLVGHNQRCAWGLTTAWQDAQDLFVERINPANPAEYEFQGQWRPIQTVQEVIAVKGRAEPEVVEVKLTHHGPIVSDLMGEIAPMALRWVALDQTDMLGAVLGYDRAANWQEFRAALASWAAPAHNFVYADVDGHIAYFQAGWMPVRAKGHGIAPVPGWSGEYEWQRFLSLDELPQALDPASGWLGVANNLVVDETYPHFISADLENPSRATRLVELLTKRDKVSAADFAAMQRDTYSAQAQRFVRHLLPTQPTNTREARALELLRGWDYHITADSVAAALYETVRICALHVIFDRHLGELADAYVGVDPSPLGDTGPYHDRSFVRLLEILDDKRGDSVWLRDPETGIPQPKGELLHRALRIALRDMKTHLGDDMETWTWGRLNRIHFAHPLGSVKPLHLLFNRGPYPMPGDRDTLLRASGKPAFPFQPVAVVDALRFIADLSDWDRCQIIVPGGQSGHVASPNYADQIPLWRDGLMLTLPFSRPAVERMARERLVLSP